MARHLSQHLPVKIYIGTSKFAYLRHCYIWYLNVYARYKCQDEFKITGIVTIITRFKQILWNPSSKNCVIQIHLFCAQCLTTFGHNHTFLQIVCRDEFGNQITKWLARFDDCCRWPEQCKKVFLPVMTYDITMRHMSGNITSPNIWQLHHKKTLTLRHDVATYGRMATSKQIYTISYQPKWQVATAWLLADPVCPKVMIPWWASTLVCDYGPG